MLGDHRTLLSVYFGHGEVAGQGFPGGLGIDQSGSYNGAQRTHRRQASRQIKDHAVTDKVLLGMSYTWQEGRHCCPVVGWLCLRSAVPSCLERRDGFRC
jgi:hypothetical protein